MKLDEDQTELVADLGLELALLVPIPVQSCQWLSLQGKVKFCATKVFIALEQK